MNKQRGIGEGVLDPIKGSISPWWRIGWKFRALQEGVQWLQNSGPTWYKPVVKVHQPKESSQLALRVREGKFPNNMNFLLQWANSDCVNVVAKKIQFLNTKAALGNMNHNAILIQSLENQLEMFQMFLGGHACK